MGTGLFGDALVTVQQPDEDDPSIRDVLVEIKEKNTGSINFGVGIGSDAGVLGNISLTQNNFDLFDVPETFAEFYRGRSFRGAGQRFAINFQPGTEIFASDERDVLKGSQLPPCFPSSTKRNWLPLTSRTGIAVAAPLGRAISTILDAASIYFSMCRGEIVSTSRIVSKPYPVSSAGKLSQVAYSTPRRSLMA